MKAKYFRFLYGETNACLIHFGEVNDTKCHEKISFLFFRSSKVSNSSEGQVEQKLGQKLERQMERKEQGQNDLFLYPESADLAVLGTVDESVKREWNETGRYVKVKRLIVPDVPEAEELFLGNVDEVIRLRPVSRDENKSGEGLWNMAAAGWKFEVICQGEGTLALWHDLAAAASEMDSAEGTETGEFSDCVMSVKAADHCMCSKDRNPDEYGCAVGCVLHKDYDVCKFRYENGANPYLTGTLLAAGTGDEEKQKGLLNWLSAKSDRIRFFSMQDPKSWMDILPDSERAEPGMRRYFIEMNAELDDHTAAEFCRQGFGSTPVVLMEGHGVCCAGFLKYAEA